MPAGTYTLELPNYSVRKEDVTPVPGQDLVVDLTLPAPIQVEITRGPGLPLIVGDWGEPNVPVFIHTPSGDTYQTITGTKLEFGPGGFETYANQIGTYMLEIENYRFNVPMNGQFTHLTFHRQVEEQVRLVSALMPRSRAETLLRDELESNPDTQGLFEIQGG